MQSLSSDAQKLADGLANERENALKSKQDVNVQIVLYAIRNASRFDEVWTELAAIRKKAFSDLRGNTYDKELRLGIKLAEHVELK